MYKKVGFISLGCPKNLVDTEIMVGILNRKGLIIVSDPKLADIIIVNTCGFIDKAKKESINAILEMSEFKKGNCKVLIVTGCLAQRYKDEVLKEIPEVDAIIGTGSYELIYETIFNIYKSLEENNKKNQEEIKKDYKKVICDKEGGIKHLNLERQLIVQNGFTYVKIAEGCDNCCSYCVIPSLRGRYISRKKEDIITEVKQLVKKGIKEIAIIAQDITRYGVDIYKKRELVNLLREIEKIEGIVWIRLLYSYPDEIDDDLINEIKRNDKICKYLDIPLQHASENILKRMGRRGSINDIQILITKLRKEIPGIMLRTTFIVGFPGETNEDFILLKEFIIRNKFDRLGIFTYSKEEGTLAFDMKKQISAKVKKKRQEELMLIQSEISLEINKKRLNKVYNTIVEGISKDGIFYFGRSYGEAPDIDGKIYFTSKQPLSAGDFVDVMVFDIDEYDLIGAAQNEFTE